MVKISCEIKDELDQKLRIFMEASGNSMVEVVRRALPHYIEVELRRNRGVRATFEKLTATVLESAGVIQLRPQRRPRKKATSGVPPQNTEASK